jgi:hypothetical protein
MDEEKLKNYDELKSQLDIAFEKAGKAGELREAKGYLIEVQKNFKGLKLQTEHREELYQRLQQEFEKVNSKIEEEHRKFEEEVFMNYLTVKEEVEKVVAQAENPADYKETWNSLLEVQSLFKETRLLKEHREELYLLLQGAFDRLKALREREKSDFENEAVSNYERLKILVDKGLKQARETNQYKETREFLKKIQSEFKGTRLLSGQREELYSRLQSAFNILGKRLDEYFRLKKKNWAVTMQYKLSQYSTDIFGLQESLKKDRSYLLELEDQLEIASGSSTAVMGLKARIASTRALIQRKEKEITDLESEMNSLKERLEEDHSDEIAK